jgi:DNA helicase-2/ATP-dependent DNA helicase PcrA
MAEKVAKLIGSAGSGKTTELLQVMDGAKKALGGSPFALGFASFTRAARAEAVARASASWGIPPEILARDGWFKTCHGVAHKQLAVARGQLIDDTKASQLWLADALKVDIRTIIDDDSGYAVYAGDRAAATALNCWEVSRARIEPLKKTIARMVRAGQDVPPFAQAKQFVQRYEQAKRLECRCDFSDLLARYAGIHFEADGLYEVEPEGELPLGVKAWIFDEAQDASALVDRVCKRLAAGPEVRWVYIAGDPFQAIFSFGGSDARHFLEWPADKTRVMPKSYRCPAPILSLGERCLRQMHEGYFDRGVAPADHDGKISRGGGPSSVVPAIDPTQPTLILARCNFTLDDWAEMLRKRKMPFAKLKSKDNTAALRGIRALWDLEHGEPVSGDDFACAIQELPARGKDGALLERGTKTLWQNELTIRRWDVVFPGDLGDTGMTQGMIDRVVGGTWGDLVTGGERWRNSAVKWGAELATRPQIRLGTIHAAKGMEADVVVLSTNTTRRIDEAQRADRDQHDEERRIEYVGVTRARRELIVSSEPVDYRMNIKL